MKRANKILIVVIVSVVLLASGAGLAYYYISKNDNDNGGGGGGGGSDDPCDLCPPPDFPENTECVNGDCVKPAPGGCIYVPVYAESPGKNYECEDEINEDCERKCCVRK